MNLYTAKYEATQPSPQAITVPLNSKYAVGVEICKNGEPTIPSTSTSLNGISADGIFNGMAVFNLSSDGNEGREIYTVASDNGYVVKDLSVYGEIPESEISGYVAPDYPELSIDMSVWEGVTVKAPKKQVSSKYDLDYPFIFKALDASLSTVYGGSFTYIMVPPGVSEYVPNGGALYQISRSGAGSSYTFKTQRASLTAYAEEVDEITFPKGAWIYAQYMGAKTRKKAWVEGAYVEKIDGDFKLFVDKKDAGIAEGYGEFDLSEAKSVNLSGTYSDDTEFSYDLLSK